MRYEDTLRLQQEYQKHQERNPFPPDEVIRLAEENVIIKGFLENWRSGNLSWEQALAGMVVYLANRNNQLEKQVLQLMSLKTPGPIAVSSQMVDVAVVPDSRSGSKTHRLKALPVYFSSVLSGEKTFDMRSDDRDYQVGDILILEEYEEYNNEYTGRRCTRLVTYVLKDYPSALKNGYVVLGIKPIPNFG